MTGSSYYSSFGFKMLGVSLSCVVKTPKGSEVCCLRSMHSHFSSNRTSKFQVKFSKMLSHLDFLISKVLISQPKNQSKT